MKLQTSTLTSRPTSKQLNINVSTFLDAILIHKEPDFKQITRQSHV